VIKTTIILELSVGYKVETKCVYKKNKIQTSAGANGLKIFQFLAYVHFFLLYIILILVKINFELLLWIAACFCFTSLFLLKDCQECVGVVLKISVAFYFRILAELIWLLSSPMLAAWLLGTRSIIQMRGSYRVRGTLSVAGQTWGETRGQLTQLILALWSPAVPAPAWAELRPSIACSSFPSALSLLDFACIALLCRNQRTPVDIAPTRKDARAIATATSTGTSTRVWLV